MRIQKLLSFTVVVVLLGVGCTSVGSILSDNRAHLNDLQPGMTKAQVLSVMGVENHRTVTNPYRTELFTTPDGVTVEVLYYATANRNNDRSFMGNELTPIVLENGRLTGWGWSYMKENASRYRGQVGAR